VGRKEGEGVPLSAGLRKIDWGSSPTIGSWWGTKKRTLIGREKKTGNAFLLRGRHTSPSAGSALNWGREKRGSGVAERLKI